MFECEEEYNEFVGKEECEHRWTERVEGRFCFTSCLKCGGIKRIDLVEPNKKEKR